MEGKKIYQGDLAVISYTRISERGSFRSLLHGNKKEKRKRAMDSVFEVKFRLKRKKKYERDARFRPLISFILYYLIVKRIDVS